MSQVAHVAGAHRLSSSQNHYGLSLPVWQLNPGYPYRIKTSFPTDGDKKAHRDKEFYAIHTTSNNFGLDPGRVCHGGKNTGR